jgi:hypothetical protein
MKMGNIASPWRYDFLTYNAPESSKIASTTIFHRAWRSTGSRRD